MKRTSGSKVFFAATLALFCLAVCFSAAAQAQATDARPSTDNEIRAMIKARVDADKKGTGIVVGIIDEHGSRVIAYGSLSEGGSPVDGDSVFEIGSITKTFTATILSDMAQRGEVDLADPIARYLPQEIKPPSFHGKPITLGELSSQVSGLPGTPSNLAPKNPANPFADYTVPQMYAAVAAVVPARASGERYEYSNFGVGLLGHILTLRAGTDYEALVRVRITQVLGMNSTGIALSGDMKKRLAVGYVMPGMPSLNWDMPALAGMGALRSTTNDLLRYVGANMGIIPSPLYPAMRSAQAPRHAIEGRPGESVGLGWHILERYGSRIVWHNGGTGGYRTYIGFDTDAHRGVVLLSNSHSGSDDIARRVLNRTFPLIAYGPPQVMLDALTARGYEQVLAIYQELRARDPQFKMDESTINVWGYEMMMQGKLKPALDILRMNAVLYPGSSNVYDSVAEAYEKNGFAAEAVDNYRRSLKMDSSNKHAEDRLRDLAPSTAKTSTD